MKQLTLEYIEDLATGPSLARGRSYYFENVVKEVVRRGNVYEARVQGTRLYSVTVVESDRDYLFHCNCPYDFGGICKHCVAVGMAIVDGDYEIDEKSSQMEEKRPEIPIEQFFTEIYEITSAAQKDDFLKILLGKERNLRLQFIAYVDEANEGESTIDIDQIRKEVHDVFAQLDFSNMDIDWHGYDSRYGYVEEWEIYYDAAKSIISDRFCHYEEISVDLIKKGRLVEGIKILLGLYEGVCNVYSPGSDEYSILDDYYDELKEEFIQVLPRVIREIDTTVKKQAMIKRTLELLIERYHYFHENIIPSEDDRIQYDLKLFENFMLMLTSTQETAHFLDALFDKYHVDAGSTAIVRIRIAEVLGNDKRWLEEAERFSESEPEIARRLMDTYLENQKRNDFYRIGRKAFRNWPDEFDEYLVKNISKAEQKKLYIKVLTHLTERKKDIERYKELRVLLSEYKKDRFIENNTLNRIFYVKMLDVEERFDEILDYVKEHKNSYDFVHLIRPILNVYSEECFSLIQQKTDETLKDQRGRRVYQEVVGWLLEMKKINATQSKTQHYFQEIWD
ncbi:MAG: hypothetical protein IIB44_08990 [Candidatus Marinimicrobia bacterium]|nr:hypothetical protein [Candidatus Neomarinimicrobiota bacterium]